MLAPAQTTSGARAAQEPLMTILSAGIEKAMPRLLVPLLLVAVATDRPVAQAPAPSPQVVALDSRFGAVIAKGTVVEKLADGFAWAEGPVWDRRTGTLLFSDVPNNVVHRWTEGSGVTEFQRPSGYMGSAPFTGREPGSNGLTFDPAGRLVLCQHGERRVARLEAQGRFTALADRYEGKRLNSPNDLVYTSNGDLYFTDPAYGLPKTFDDPARELPFAGVYRLKPDGALTLLTKAIRRPNGLAFSPDEKTLYVAQSHEDEATITAFPVTADGTLGEGKVLIDETADVKAGKPGLPDGMKVDVEGRLWATGPGGVWVIAPDGTALGRIETGVPTANVAWGGDGSVLYITANTTLLRVKTTTKGKMP
jgi:gluconolactonase